MSLPRLNETQPSPPPAPCVGIGGCITIGRTISASLYDTGGTLDGSNNMMAWVKAYDMSQIGWNFTRYVNFSSYGDTTPQPNPIDQQGWYNYTQTTFFSVYNPPYPSPLSSVSRTQVLIGGAIQYFILAIGIDTSVVPAASICVEGCASAIPDNYACVPESIVELPIPDLSLGYLCNTYIFRTRESYPTLAAMAANLCPRYGTNWNPNQLCQPIPPASDPFQS